MAEIRVAVTIAESNRISMMTELQATDRPKRVTAHLVAGTFTVEWICLSELSVMQIIAILMDNFSKVLGIEVRPWLDKEDKEDTNV